ncbi:hypothetical protein ABC382_00675 [Lysinibacillus sp. 1P01SD]|uniref:hypothetical protein n=1 Tax=Lysinibacillus sp. 1P01SD TaxID=3132285 RepID=UPI0039A314BA
MKKINFILTIVWSLLTIAIFYFSLEKAHDERLNQVLQQSALNKDECSKYAGGLIGTVSGKSENSTISNVKISGSIKLPVGCKDYFEVNTIGFNNGSTVGGVENDFKIEFYDPIKTNFFEIHILPIMYSLFIALVAYIISFGYKKRLKKKAY